MKRLLITGGAGYLGARLTHLADAAYDVYPTFFSNTISHRNAIQLDLRDKDTVEKLISEIKPDAIIHQAISNKKEEHIAAIVPAANIIANAAIEHDIRLIHVSTDLVFNGNNPPYKEDSPTSPVNPYGAAKARAEDLLMHLMPDKVLIVRPSLIYGFDPIDKQTSWLVNGIKNKQTVKLFTDEYRCPIWVDNLANVLLEVVENKLTGVLNVAGTQSLNRWDYAMKILKALNIAPNEYVVKSTIAESGMTRPADLTMDLSKAQQILKTKLMTLDEVISRL